MSDAVIKELERSVRAERYPHPKGISAAVRRFLPPEDLLERLLERYTSAPVPPCQVCGKELSVQAMGGGPTVYACEKPDGVSFGEWADHYSQSRWTQVRTGDPDVIALVKAVEKALGAAKKAN